MTAVCSSCKQVSEIALELEVPKWVMNEKGEEEYMPQRHIVCFACAYFDDNVAAIR